ncbi:MAG: N-formylglutamate amidohydrolase [Chitinophagales bacterium]
MKRLILHIPHSSVNIPLKEGYIVSEEILQSEIVKLTDWHTEDLFHSIEDEMIIAPFSRIFCDPERFPDDEQEIMAQYGMGVLYEKTDNGNVMRIVTPELRKKILEDYYWKHHYKLNNAVKNQLEQYNKAIIIDCHSYPEIPIERSLVKSSFRPDFNIGTDEYHTPRKLIDISVDFFKQKGYSLGIDLPYTGSIVPLEYYRKNENVQSIMLEINRKLYLKEDSNEKSANFQHIKTVTKEFINAIRSTL